MLSRRDFSNVLVAGGASSILPKSFDVNCQLKPVDTGFALLPDLHTIVKNCVSNNEDKAHYWGRVVTQLVEPNMRQYILQHINNIDFVYDMYMGDRITKNIWITQHCNSSVFRNGELHKINDLFETLAKSLCNFIKQNNIGGIDIPLLLFDTIKENKIGLYFHAWSKK